MEHGDIITFLKENPGHDRIRALYDIVSGLQYLHSLSPPVVHGDIKGANILVDGHHQCLLADFGLADILADTTMMPTTSSGGIKGSTRWMAPEMFSFASGVDVKGDTKGNSTKDSKKTPRDIYAFACTVLEIMTGKPPFHHLIDAAVIFQVSVHHIRPERPSEGWCPDHIWDLVELCWGEDPLRRPTATMLQRYLHRLIEAGNPFPGDPSFISYLNPDDPSLDSRTAGRSTLGAELSDIKEVDPTPFRFKPHELAFMFHPKSYETLESFGGVTDHDAGNDLARTGTNESHEGRGDRQGKVTSVDDLGTVSCTEEGDDDKWDNSGALSASFADRRRVYGENSLPVRKARRLFDHMALVMWDNIKLTWMAVSPAFGFPDAIGTHSAEGPPVVFFEGVTTVAAIFIVVVGIVSPIQAWQQERQVRALENKRDKLSVKVVRNGLEEIVDFREVVVGDIALLGPGENILCNGILLSGHNVRCDESAVTGESDVIKKVTWAEWTTLRQKEKEGGKILLVS
ncbi:plasma membrane calcium [Marasmius tenuissimus]|uniref:Plasma membrane calcium n=1 Tax=Marasmius tenuissimus TaxID=585030 RepID=A0ABR2ZP98_9AGAR